LKVVPNHLCIDFAYFMKRVFFLFFLVLVSSGLAIGQNYQTQTLYIYSFGKFIQWPEENRTGDFEITVLGESPIIVELQKMAEKKKLGDRAIKINKVGSIKELRKGHVLFIPAAQSALLGECLSKIGNQPILIVTEQTGLGTKGSDINFLTKEDRLVFELNQTALTKHKLKAANELTRLAILI
jgi:hypothetical protein